MCDFLYESQWKNTLIAIGIWEWEKEDDCYSCRVSCNNNFVLKIKKTDMHEKAFYFVDSASWPLYLVVSFLLIDFRFQIGMLWSDMLSCCYFLSPSKLFSGSLRDCNLPMVSHSHTVWLLFLWSCIVQSHKHFPNVWHTIVFIRWVCRLNLATGTLDRSCVTSNFIRWYYINTLEGIHPSSYKGISARVTLRIG